MNISALVFSNNPRFRITRHLLFWSSWILYDTIFVTISWSKYSFAKAFIPSLFVEIFSFPLDIIFCYTIIYFLIPRFLYKGRYINMILLWLLLSFCYIICFRLYTTHINPLIYSAYGMPFRMHSASFIWDFFDLFSQINMEGALAASIKLGKMWYIKHQELDLMKKEKLKSESDAEDGKIQPVFLVSALDRFEILANNRPDIIPGMIRKIKNLMMYAIYDYNQPKVTLQREIELLKEYIELEKADSGKCINVSMKLPENISTEQISPFIILPLVENSFRQLALIDMPEKYINLDSKLYAGNFAMTISWSKPVDTSTLYNGSNSSLHTISKRLNLLYPQSHKIKIVIKPEEFVIHLKIDLDKAVN
ncbi:MAG TPA: histidine kinase [Puia sp.]|nr:histidine kinase [Puia sp.]